MSVNGVASSTDLLGMMGAVTQRTTADDASMGVAKKAIDAQAAMGADLAKLVSELASGSQLDVYA